jgi:hypothetical protein
MELQVNDQMLSKKHLNKVRDDIKKVKEIVSEMQINVSTHNFKINKDMIDNEKL